MTERYILIRCDVCQSPSDMEDLACVNEKQLRKDLQERGWHFERESRIYDKRDLCPDCANGGR